MTTRGIESRITTRKKKPVRQSRQSKRPSAGDTVASLLGQGNRPTSGPGISPAVKAESQRDISRSRPSGQRAKVTLPAKKKAPTPSRARPGGGGRGPVSAREIEARITEPQWRTPAQAQKRRQAQAEEFILAADERGQMSASTDLKKAAKKRQRVRRATSEADMRLAEAQRKRKKRAAARKRAATT